jgi:hypothetical protein
LTIDLTNPGAARKLSKHRLTDVYAHLPADQISTVVAQAHARFEHSAVRDFIPLLVERRARAELSRHSELLAAAG